MQELITINSLKFDGSIHRSWNCELINQKDSLLILVGKFDEEVKHSKLGVIGRGTVSYEYYWLDRWFNVFRFHEPDGSLRNYYCNINIPPKFENNILSYTDLEIDILVWKNFDIEILDLDEFELNSKKFCYSNELKEKVKATLNEILLIINSRQFPFDFN